MVYVDVIFVFYRSFSVSALAGFDVLRFCVFAFVFCRQPLGCFVVFCVLWCGCFFCSCLFISELCGPVWCFFVFWFLFSVPAYPSSSVVGMDVPSVPFSFFCIGVASWLILCPLGWVWYVASFFFMRLVSSISVILPSLRGWGLGTLFYFYLLSSVGFWLFFFRLCC